MGVWAGCVIGFLATYHILKDLLTKATYFLPKDFLLKVKYFLTKYFLPKALALVEWASHFSGTLQVKVGNTTIPLTISRLDAA